MELRNPSSEKSGDLVVLVVLAAGAILGLKQATTPGTSLHKLFFPGDTSLAASTNIVSTGSITPVSNPSAPWESCPAYNAQVNPAQAGGFVGTVRQLFEKTYPGGAAYAFGVWQSQGGRC